MRQLLRTIIFAILIVDVITKIEISVSTNETNNEHNTISLDENPIVTELAKISYFHGSIIGIFAPYLVMIICWCSWFCISACIIRLRVFFARRTVERPARAPEMDLVYMAQRQEEIHNLPPNVVETDL